MAPVITLTVNPCIDISAHIPVLSADKKLHCTNLVKQPGGGGINISRVIQRFSGNTIAVYPAGGYTGDFLRRCLIKKGCVPQEFILMILPGKISW